MPTTNIAASVPLIATFGVPVRFRSEVPRFSTVKVIAPLEPPDQHVAERVAAACRREDRCTPCFTLISGAIPVPVSVKV